MKIAAHPTTYAGARFRSRLEARWAAFFDLAGWRWEYEPFDGTGWGPDFLLLGARSNVLVEVKPIEWSGGSQFYYEQQANERQDLNKVRRSGEQVLVLGLYPVPSSYQSPFLGVELTGPAVDSVFLRGGSNLKIEPAPDQTDVGMISGVPTSSDVSWSVVGDLWRQAGALTQWRAA